MKEFSEIKLMLASPESIRANSHGEVIKSETINYRSLVPERDGLFCEAIFGTTKDYQCSCGRYKKTRFKGVVCEKCGVEVTKSSVRRERMGHIELAVPVLHIWHLRGTPNVLGNLLGVAQKDLDAVTYFSKSIIIDPGNSKFKKFAIVTEKDCLSFINEKEGNTLKYGMGAEAILECLSSLNLNDLQEEIKNEANAEVVGSQKKKKLIKRLEIIKNFLASGNKPEWMVLQALPVMPADLRPMVQLDGGRFAISDLNDVYRKVLNRNRRLKRLQQMMAPEIILRNEKRMLQQAVDALIDNSKSSTSSTSGTGRELRSLSKFLIGKQGRFRQNLLGKRVDYSGRSVIVVGPNLKLHQCGLPKKMALELFKPFIIRDILKQGLAANIKSAKKLIDSEADQIWAIVEEVIKGHPVLLNRPPTLHKHSIQAFEPVLIDGKSISVHPLVCSAFNADFDGDNMSVHIPLSPAAIVEAKVIMLASNNLISPANGRPIISPSREMLMGCYYVTKIKKDAKGTGKIFSSTDEAELAYENTLVAINAGIKVRIDGKIIETTVGRIMLNNLFPKELRNYEKSFVGGDFRDIISKLYKMYGESQTGDIVNQIKDLGFKFGTLAGITIGIDDLVIPSTKNSIINEAKDKLKLIDEDYKNGLTINEERYRALIDVWNNAVEKITSDIVKEVDPFNPLFMMSQSGARGGLTQMRQLSGMRGLMSDTKGNVMEIPITSNFRQGLKMFEFFMSAYGARKGAADRALRTADSGYLTRRLVDVSHDVIITEEDCGTELGISIYDLKDNDGNVIESFAERLLGRTVAKDILINDQKIISKNTILNESLIDLILTNGIKNVIIRSPLTCETKMGMCAKCYGMDLSNHRPVVLGEAVGVIAAQSIGEPGTQLTMRTFHTGGVSEKESTVSKLLANENGTVRYLDVKSVENSLGQTIISDYSSIVISDKEYYLDPGSILIVKDGAAVKQNDILAELNPYASSIVNEQEGYIDFSDVNFSEQINHSFGIKEKIVLSSSHKDSNDILIRNSKKGDVIAKYSVPSGAFLLKNNGDKINIGDIIAKMPKEDQKSKKDITGGLPKIQQLLEIRNPSNRAIISNLDGTLTILPSKKRGLRVVKIENDNNFVEYLIPSVERILVNENSKVRKGQKITEGTIAVSDLLEIEGIMSAQIYILESVQAIYREQGVKINDKHVEIIIKQMFKKVKILDGGSSLFLEGEVAFKQEILDLNEKIAKEGGSLIKYAPIIQGITKASINTDSFISAASFQETTKVLSNAAINGSVDKLNGLKENVIIGRKIPAGTGLDYYKKLDV
jgi:DNA-directed RNA polymerase subunit beta'